jgi:hypothetical protein
MGKYKVPFTLKCALWNAYGRKCFYTGDPVEFKDLEIDHLVPENIKEDSSEYRRLKSSKCLPDGFGINTTFNLVPTHHSNNRKKGQIRFQGKNLIFFLELIRSKQKSIELELEKLNKQAENEKALIGLLLRIEKGYLSKLEAISIIHKEVLRFDDDLSDPIIVSFSVNILSIIDSDVHWRHEYLRDLSFYNLLENKLINTLKNNNLFAVQTEASERNGETASMRFAFWFLDVNTLQKMYFIPWEIMEISYFSKVYGEKASLSLYEFAIEKNNCDMKS